MNRRRVGGGVVAAALLAGGAMPAYAQDLGLRVCSVERDMRCGALRVPVDRTVPDGAALTLAVRILPATGRPRGTIVLLAGGPGQAAIAPGGAFERTVARQASGYEVVVLNQRGTGATALRCPSLDAAEAADAITAAVARCAQTIGPARTHFATPDSVADLDALRAALGLDRVALLGVSYGTVVATAYARAHPTRVSRLVLDSLAGPEGNQAVDTETYAAARRVLGELCAGRRCDGITADLIRDVARLETRLAVRGVRGVRVDAGGRTHRAVFGGPADSTALMRALGAGDLNPAARATFPAAVRTALGGDGTMLLRIASAGGTPDDPAAMSTALFVATTCAESSLPWTATTPVDQRPALLAAALAAPADAAFAPFRRPAESTVGGVCTAWPESPSTRLDDGAGPDVPVLVLEGSQDVRTPVETARRSAGAFPGARIVVVRGAGHSVLTGGGTCAATAVGRFLAGRAVGRPCRGVDERPAPARIPPASLAAMSPVALPGLRGRTLAAVRVTIADLDAAVGFGDSSTSTVRFTGRLGGRGTLTGSATGGVRIALDRFRYVPGVSVSGTLRLTAFGSRAVLRVGGGAAAAGTVTIANGVATGVLGGRPFRTAISAPTG